MWTELSISMQRSMYIAYKIVNNLWIFYFQYMYPPTVYNVQIVCPFKDLAWYESNDSYPMETNLLLNKV